MIFFFLTASSEVILLYIPNHSNTE